MPSRYTAGECLHVNSYKATSHIVTLDGFKYTFNGLGEYCLIDTPGNQFTLQGRMEVPMGGTLPSDITATVFTAIVAKEVASDTVQFQLTADGQSLEMLMNGIVVDFSELAEQSSLMSLFMILATTRLLLRSLLESIWKCEHKMDSFQLFFSASRRITRG